MATSSTRPNVPHLNVPDPNVPDPNVPLRGRLEIVTLHGSLEIGPGTRLRREDPRPAMVFGPQPQPAPSALRPGSILAAIEPHLGAEEARRYVHFGRAGVRVDGKPGPCLLDPLEWSSCITALAQDLVAAMPPQLPPAERLAYFACAKTHAKGLCASLVVQSNPQPLTVGHLFDSGVATQLSILRKVSLKALSEQTTRWWGSLPEGMRKPVVEDAMRITRDVYMDAIAGFAGAMVVACRREPDPALRARPFGAQDLAEFLGQVLCDGLASDTLQLERMFLAVREDPQLTEPLLAMLEDITRALRPYARGEWSAMLDAVVAALVLGLPAHSLERLAVTQDDIEWLVKHAFFFLGHSGWTRSTSASESFRGSVRKQDDPMGQCRVLFGVAREFVGTPQGKAQAARVLKGLDVLRANAERDARQTDRLWVVEAALRAAFPEDGVDFEGEEITELLDCFFPLQPRTITHAPDEPVRVHVSTGEKPAAPAQAEQEGEPFSIEFWKAQWKEFKRAKAERAEAARAAASREAAAAEAPAAEVAGRSWRPDRQPGARPRATGYGHHTNFRDLPNPERKRRRRELHFGRTESRYTAGHRQHRETKHVALRVEDVD